MERQRSIACSSCQLFDGQCAPAFFLVATEKAGTSMLHWLLGHHPQVRMPLRKENYITWRCQQEHLQRLMSSLPPSRFTYEAAPGTSGSGQRLQRVLQGNITGDIDPRYSRFGSCFDALHSLPAIATAKLIAIVREPIDRAISKYLNARSDHPEMPAFPLLVSRVLPLVYGCTQKGHEAFASCLTSGSDLLAGIQLRIFGLSVYDLVFTRWLRDLESGRMLLLDNSDLEAPEKLARRLETHLCLLPHKYTQLQPGLRVNARYCYGWTATLANGTCQGGRSQADMRDLPFFSSDLNVTLRSFYQKHMHSFRDALGGVGVEARWPWLLAY